MTKQRQRGVSQPVPWGRDAASVYSGSERMRALLTQLRPEFSTGGNRQAKMGGLIFSPLGRSKIGGVVQNYHYQAKIIWASVLQMPDRFLIPVHPCLQDQGVKERGGGWTRELGRSWERLQFSIVLFYFMLSFSATHFKKQHKCITYESVNCVLWSSTRIHSRSSSIPLTCSNKAKVIH